MRNGVEHEPAVRVQTNDGTWHLEDTWGPTTRITLPLKSGRFTYFDDGALTESEILRGAGEGRRFVTVKLDPGGETRIAGRPLLQLVASSDQPSTHLIAVLSDVSDTGQRRVISRAFLNARYRGNRAKGSDIEPGKRYTFELEFIDKDHVLEKDHHLEVAIASASTTWVASDERRSTNTLYLDESRLILPIRR